MSRGRDRREKPAGRYIQLREYMLASPAWQSLDCISRCLYIELARRYRGPNSNNGKIPLSVREAASALGCGKSTAGRCFDQLQDHGFIKIGKLSGFNIKGRVSTEWLLTEFPDDTLTGALPSKDFMKWVPEKLKHSPITGTHSPITGTVMYLQRDRVALGQR